MSTLRKLERQVIKNQSRNKNGNNKGFQDAWNEYRIKKYTDEFGEVHIPMDTSKKKLFFYDNKNQMIQSVKNMFGIKQKINDLVRTQLIKGTDIIDDNEDVINNG